jgi:hypothetical protein
MDLVGWSAKEVSGSVIAQVQLPSALQIHNSR